MSLPCHRRRVLDLSLPRLPGRVKLPGSSREEPRTPPRAWHRRRKGCNAGRRLTCLSRSRSFTPSPGLCSTAGSRGRGSQASGSPFAAPSCGKRTTGPSKFQRMLPMLLVVNAFLLVVLIVLLVFVLRSK